MPFRQADVRRLQTMFDAAVEQPFEAEVTLTADRMHIAVAIKDPDDLRLTVANCQFDYDTHKTKAREVQPSDYEVGRICESFQAACEGYPAAKASAAAETAARAAHERGRRLAEAREAELAQIAATKARTDAALAALDAIQSPE